MSSLLNEGSSRQKRVLPSRHRRGGPGIGNCEVDQAILDVQKRKSESDPLIPASTRFLLTTDVSLVPSAPSGAFRLNEFANNLYFDKPEVMKSFKEQLEIQTPEFVSLDEVVIVGGRRTRQEEEQADTSDAAYEKRHRKYETFEKRQRLREREKLKHEQYKLKERIEQLRGMDNASFLAIEASNFTEPPNVDDEQPIPEDIAGSNLPGLHPNGAAATAAYNEGERRRKEMLDNAAGLEERYRILLPPERRHAERRERVASERTAVHPEGAEYTDSTDAKYEENGDEDMDDEEDLIPIGRPTLKIRLSHKGRASVAAAAAQSAASEEAAPTSSGEPYAAPPSRHGKQAVRSHSPIVYHPIDYMEDFAPEEEFDQLQDDDEEYGFTAPPKRKPSKKKTPGPILTTAPMSASVAPGGARMLEGPAHGSISAPPPRQKTKTIRSRTPKPLPPAPCSILVAARRNADLTSVRKTQRYVMAFGTKIPDPFPSSDFDNSPWVQANCPVDEESLGGPPGASQDNPYAPGPSISVSREFANVEFSPPPPPFSTSSRTSGSRALAAPSAPEFRTNSNGRIIESESPPPEGERQMYVAPPPVTPRQPPPPATPVTPIFSTTSVASGSPADPNPIKRGRGRPVGSRGKAALEREAIAAQRAADIAAGLIPAPLALSPRANGKRKRPKNDSGGPSRKGRGRPRKIDEALEPPSMEPPSLEEEAAPVEEPSPPVGAFLVEAAVPQAPAQSPQRHPSSSSRVYAAGVTSPGLIGPGGRSLDSPEMAYEPPANNGYRVISARPSSNGIPPPPPPLPDSVYISPSSSRRNTHTSYFSPPAQESLGNLEHAFQERGSPIAGSSKLAVAVAESVESPAFEAKPEQGEEDIVMA